MILYTLYVIPCATDASMQDMRVRVDKATTPDDPPGKVCLISHKVFSTSLCTNEFPHESVNLFFVLVIEKDKLTGLWGS